MKISTFDLNLFVVLNAIYTEGSLTKAAEVVGITQPAVSNALARLREKFDDDLFIMMMEEMLGISYQLVQKSLALWVICGVIHS